MLSRGGNDGKTGTKTLKNYMRFNIKKQSLKFSWIHMRKMSSKSPNSSFETKISF